MTGYMWRECDLIEIDEKIFDVKGHHHPPGKIISSPKYVPDPDSNRVKDGIRYKKVGFEELWGAFNSSPYLTYDPVFREKLVEIPSENIKHHFMPTARLEELRSSADGVEDQLISFAEMVKREADIPWTCLGVSGSILVGLHSGSSDMDLVVYGSKNCKKAYGAIKRLREDDRLNGSRVEDCFDVPSDEVKIKMRKLLEGRFEDRRYSVRFVRDWDEIRYGYGEFRCFPLGSMEIRAEVVDDSESIFDPCRYGINKVEVLKGPEFIPSQIISYHGGFCEQAEKGEKIVSSGKLERVRWKDGGEKHILVLEPKRSHSIRGKK